MDKKQLVHKRKKRYMAQALAVFDEHALPHLPPDVAERVKGIFRQKFNALAVDAEEIIDLKPGEELNGAVIELRDQMHVEGRPVKNRSTPA